MTTRMNAVQIVEPMEICDEKHFCRAYNQDVELRIQRIDNCHLGKEPAYKSKRFATNMKQHLRKECYREYLKNKLEEKKKCEGRNEN